MLHAPANRAGSIGDDSSILVPHRLLGNMYISGLGRAYQKLGARVVYGPENLFESALRFDLIHLQWPEELYRGYGSGDLAVRVSAFLERLDELKRRGARLIWTVHNLIPHEHRGSDLDHGVYQEVINRADMLVHHCDASVEGLGRSYAVPSGQHFAVVPFGNFRGYPDRPIDRAAAREILGVPRDAVVYLQFGAIRGYKGFGTLLGAFDRARVSHKFLLVAGHYAGSGGLSGKLSTLRLVMRQRFGRRSLMHLRMIDDEDVVVYLRAADAVVLSHSHGLNSGVAVLGMTFGKLVIGPDIGCIGFVLRQGDNIVYPVSDVDALARALEAVPGRDLAAVAQANIAAARAWEWQTVARAILEAVARMVKA